MLKTKESCRRFEHLSAPTMYCNGEVTRDYSRLIHKSNRLRRSNLDYLNDQQQNETHYITDQPHGACNRWIINKTRAKLSKSKRQTPYRFLIPVISYESPRARPPRCQPFMRIAVVIRQSSGELVHELCDYSKEFQSRTVFTQGRTLHIRAAKFLEDSKLESTLP